jgi:hypothetical protein
MLGKAWFVSHSSAYRYSFSLITSIPEKSPFQKRSPLPIIKISKKVAYPKSDRYSSSSKSDVVLTMRDRKQYPCNFDGKSP